MADATTQQVNTLLGPVGPAPVVLPIGPSTAATTPTTTPKQETGWLTLLKPIFNGLIMGSAVYWAARQAGANPKVAKRTAFIMGGMEVVLVLATSMLSTEVKVVEALSPSSTIAK